MQLIAEIGLNHNGRFDVAIEMIKAAKYAGADIVKFQYFLTDILCLNRNDFSAYALLDKIKMHEQWIPLLKAECDRSGVEFLCTVFCKYSAEAIAPYVKRFKIASPEACNLEFIKEVAKYGIPLILSTGKATQEQLDRIFDNVQNDITLLYCVSKYPALPDDIRLEEIDRLRKRYRCKVGYSDHTQGIKKSIEAYKLGAAIIERHFKLNEACCDAVVSLNQHEFKKLSEVLHGR